MRPAHLRSLELWECINQDRLDCAVSGAVPRRGREHRMRGDASFPGAPGVWSGEAARSLQFE